ncbi:MAG TPA: gliding motility-associated C-terminal domain-containing protein, partial [Bacteroidales bacterium]|nr:gliding motility-associated C-terminal domain-containing protein [Bacteroidales bacterium]
TYSITDDCGNSITVTQTISVGDITPPTASVPAPVTVECSADVPAPDISVVTDEADNCTANPVVAFVGDVSDGLSCPETITRTYSVTDDCNNSITLDQIITINDITNPTATNPAPINVFCMTDVPAPDISVVTDEADNCTANPLVAWVGDTDNGGTCPLIISRTYSITDDCGNSITVTQTITANDDVLPTATAPAPVSVQCLADVPAPDTDIISDEADNCDIPVVAFVSDVSDGLSCPETITRTYSVTDACNNQILLTQSITVNDDTPPTAGNPAPVTVECFVDIPAADITVVPGVSDNCTANPLVAFVSDASDGLSCPETITRTYSVTDDCANSITVTQTIVVNDITPPTASNPAPVNVECNADVPLPDISVVTDEADNCTANPLVAFVSDASDGLSCPETITRTYSITDDCGNSITVTQTITVVPTTNPVLPANGATTVTCITETTPPVTPVVYDACGNLLLPVMVNIVDNPDPMICSGTRTYNYSYTDCAGNVAIWSYVYTIDDPIITVTCPPTQVFDAIPGDNYTIPQLVATSNCGSGFTITWSIDGATIRTGIGPDASGLFNVGISYINWTITDFCGTVHNCITEVEIVFPAITCPLNFEVCLDDDLQLLSNTGENPAGGSFSGNGVILSGGLYYFDPSVGVGNHLITYTWVNEYNYSGNCTYEATVNALPVFTVTSTQNPLCDGNSNGSISILMSAGLPDFNINWGSGSATSSMTNYTINNLPAGTYNITVSDGNGCSYTTSATLINPPSVTATISVTSDYFGQDISCYSNSDGSAIVNPTGGTIPYTYQWSISAGSQTTQEAYNLPAGIHYVTIFDANNCQYVASITLNEPDAIDINITINNHVRCYGESNGSVVAAVSGGTGPYIYTWNDPGITHMPYNNNLPAGTWTLTVEDANGCSATEQVTITQPNLLDVQFVNVDDVSCFGLSDGSATALVTGGTAPYFYEWDDPGHSTSAGISGLPMGTYNVTITDANGCTLTDFIYIAQPDPLEVTTSSQPVQCGVSLGSVSAQVSGGTLPYEYLWTGGYNSQQVPGLISGTYRLTVTDAHGCSAESVVYVGMQGNGVVTITEDQSITCFGETNAILTANMINGVSPMAYIWSNSGNTATIQNLAAGIYSVTVTDSWGCSGTQSHMVTEPTEIHLAFATTPVTCFGGSDGTAAVSVTGGIAPYTYSWSNGSSQNTASGLSAGNYVVTIHDAHYCEIIGNVIVTQPENPVTLNMVVGNISCFGMHDGYVNLFVTGGVPPYTYLWQIGENTTNVPNIDNLYEGIYNLHVEDANHCVNDTSVAVSQPAPLSATWISQGPSCIGNNDGYIELTVTGGTAPYSFTWGTGTSPVEYISGLVEGQYLITILDSMACEAEVGPITIIDVQEDCIRIPNAFTPNADGVNDTWIIDNIDMYPRAYIEVFNRWGQCIFEAKGSEDPWDGTYNGKIVPTGPYIYVVNLFNGDEAYTGTVTIVR